MNLIELFGIYEKAKKAFDELCEHEKDLITCGRVVLTKNELSDALLEYRRANNIFEVGDKVLEVGDDCEMVILIVNSITKKMMVCVNDGLDASYVLSKKYNPSYYVRHATDLEIQAGHRLPTCEVPNNGKQE